MSNRITSIEIPLKPEWQAHVTHLANCVEMVGQDIGDEILDRFPLEIKFLVSLLADLQFLGWRWKVKDFVIAGQLEPDSGVDGYGDLSPELTRKLSHRLRNQMLVKRQPFIESMEEMKRFNLELVSIYSLMRNGAVLGEQLDEISRGNEPSRRERLESLIKPYIQFVEEGEKDEFTNLSLLYIWRYFRYTWSTPYTDAPVRSVKALVRDAAADFHPVIGIFELRNSVAQQGLRDESIGWQPDAFINQLVKKGGRKEALWLIDQVQARINDVYVIDFINESILSRLDIEYPRESIIDRLCEVGIKAREQHKSVAMMPPVDEYEKNALMPLFRAKRAEELARLLRVRILFQDVELEKFTRWQFKKLRENKELIGAITELLKSVRSRNVGIHMMDLTTCGAIAPYNHLLGGKLVTMLATSPEVVDYYNKKYGNQISDIASKMAGRPIIKPPQLCLLNTTSLYARNSSQYNRLSMPLKGVEKDEIHTISFKKLGRTFGKGTNHLSERTVNLAKDYLNSVSGSKTKSRLVMGEGASPLLRNISEAGARIGVGKQVSLAHNQSRIVYSVPLAKNWRDVLLGNKVKANYFLKPSSGKKGTQEIVNWWFNRWFADRVFRSNRVEKVRAENLEYPIRHGARVPLYALISRDNLELEF